MTTTTTTTTIRPYSRYKKALIFVATIIFLGLCSNTFTFFSYFLLPPTSPPSITKAANNHIYNNDYNPPVNNAVGYTNQIQQHQNDAFILRSNGEIIEPPPSSQTTTTRPLGELKFLTLGASITYGASLPNRNLAYPYLLSHLPQQISNLAVRASGPKYPSVCIQSMLLEEAARKGFGDEGGGEEEEEYDVIVLEYYMRGHEGLYTLTKRLRERYPDAIIILLRLWTPVHIVWYHEDSKQQVVGTLKDWALENDLAIQSDEFLKRVTEEKVDLRWPMMEMQQPRNEIQERIMVDFGANLYTLESHDDPKEALQLYRQWFAEDYSHLSEEGHYHVYRGILRIVFREIHNAHYPLRPRIGTWGGGGDVCHSWYASGTCPLTHSSNVSMENYDPKAKDKFALSTGTKNTMDVGWIVVENPFLEPRNLILSYMISGPPPSMYPKIAIIVEPLNDGQEQTEENAQTHVVDPVTNYFPQKVHIVKTTKVAVIPSGQFRVSWKPLEDTGHPFRVVATAVVGTDVEEGGVLGAAVDFTFLEDDK